MAFSNGSTLTQTEFQLEHNSDGTHKDAVGVPQNGILHITGTSVPTGYTEDTAGRGFVIVGLVASGTAAGTVGTAFTNLQNKTHTHSGSTTASVDATAAGGSGTNFSRDIHTHAVTIGNASTSDVLAYIQRLGIVKN